MDKIFFIYLQKMIVQLPLLIIMLLKLIESQKVLEFSSFTDDTFTNFDGILITRNEVGI